jgi:hypothetical protein
MRTVHFLTDRYGPRLTGSPNYEAAARWVAASLTEWGLKNARLEPWDFGHPGWTNERAAGFLIAPVKQNLKFEVLSWTPSTRGAVSGSAVHVIPPQGPPPPEAQTNSGTAAPAQQGPTKEELNEWMEANKSKVAGRMVLVGKAAVIPVDFNPPRKRTEDARLREQFDPKNDNAAPAPRAAADPNRLTAAQVNARIDSWLLANRALVRINDAGRAHGQIRAFQNRTYDTAKAPPTVVLRNEDFGRIERLLAARENVRLEFNIVNRTHPEGKTTYNVIAEIPGSDRANEFVMLGGHLDSWHGATGATDNASGVAAAMEAVRAIKALGLQPRRTIRIALWSAEEQGLLGSKAYVRKHLGTFEKPAKDFDNFQAYFNLDGGTGRVRGANIFGPPAAADVLRAALEHFEDMGTIGALATAIRATGGTDSTSFNAAGLAGVNFAQDPIEYQTSTWHTNIDTYERIVPEDLKKASTVLAALVWHVANRDEPMPKFPREKMPASANTN